MLKKICVHNSRKVPHPNHAMWHKCLSPEEKAAKNKKISDSMKKYHANKSEHDKRLTRIRMSENTCLFLNSHAGREEKLYRRYLSRNYQLGLKGEERKRILAKRGAGRKKAWDKVSPEERKKLGQKTRRIKMGNLIQLDCPRVNDFCGVVKEQIYA